MRKRPPHPPFNASKASGRIDTFSERGANELANQIRHAWKQIGYDVEVRVEHIASTSEDDGRSVAHFAVRSDLVDGLPRSAAA